MDRTGQMVLFSYRFEGEGVILETYFDDPPLKIKVIQVINTQKNAF